MVFERRMIGTNRLNGAEMEASMGRVLQTHLQYVFRPSMVIRRVRIGEDMFLSRNLPDRLQNFILKRGK